MPSRTGVRYQARATCARGFALLAALAAASLTGAAPRTLPPVVAIMIEPSLDPVASHGIVKLREALAAGGFRVAEFSSNLHPEVVVLAGVGRGTEAARILAESKTRLPAAAEALVVRRSAKYHGRPALVLYGADARGLMYAALDVAARVSPVSRTSDPFENVRDATEEPFLAERGVSMYTMHRAYFESRLFDERHWQKYFDMLAASRINNFVVIFGYENGGFMAPPYPYFFDVPEFPQVKFVGLTSAEQSRNTAAFKRMMRLAHDRGITVTAAIWDHIYRGGVQTGGIPGAPKAADASVPGLVWGVTGDNLPSYTKAALRRFLQVFPEVDAIQFRMHEESGLKREEMVPFWHEVFSLIKQAKPDMHLDLRAKDLPDAVIEDALKQGLAARVSTKFWMEQMGLPFHPTHINPQNQRDRRHGYADLLQYPQRYRGTGSCGAAARRVCCSGAILTTSAASPVPPDSMEGTASRLTKCSPPRCWASRTETSPSTSSRPPLAITSTSSSATGISTSSGDGSRTTRTRPRTYGRVRSRIGLAPPPDLMSCGRSISRAGCFRASLPRAIGTRISQPRWAGRK